MMKEDVANAIEEIRPRLQADGGDIQLVEVQEDGTVKVRLTGACDGCPMAVMTLKQGVEAFLKEKIPQVKEVVGV
jgi:Fe-S cluster biogenesis protein NfuA